METERLTEEETGIPAFQLFHHFRSHKVEKKIFNVKPATNVYLVTLYVVSSEKSTLVHYIYLVTKYTMFTLLIYIGIFSD